MSGYTNESIVFHGGLESDMAFLQKPVTPTSLATKLREVLAKDL
jgi:two-component system, cell cycle sensor histidine kinase and response regulator CckA